MIEAFGIEAERFAQRFDDAELVVTDGGNSAAALQAAVMRRLSGRPFFVSAIVDEPRAVIAQVIAGPLLHQHRSTDERRNLFDALAVEQLVVDERPQNSITVMNQQVAQVLRDFISSGPALWTRSTCEYERIQRLLNIRKPYAIAAPGYDPIVPAFVPTARDRIVVWAPLLDAARLGIIAVALETFRYPITYICASGTLPDVRGRFVGLSEANEELAHAVCVVDASLGDPAAAITLAQRGLTVVSATTAGAAEFLDGALEYEPWNWRLVHEAVSVAIGAPATAIKHDPFPKAEIARTLRRADAPQVVEPPLISIVCATYNRPERLVEALDSIAAQTYSNIEAIVMNDAGADVSEIAARYPFVRLHTLEANVGCSAAFARGATLVSGEYFCILPDDDLIAADHVMRLVSAILASGTKVAHCDTMTGYQILEDGKLRYRGFKANNVRAFDPLENYGGPMVTQHALLMHRDLVPIFSHIDPITGWSDQEQQLLFSQTTDFAHVNQPTILWHYNVANITETTRVGQEGALELFRALHARYPHPSTIVARIRKSLLDDIATRYPNLSLPDLLLA